MNESLKNMNDALVISCRNLSKTFSQGKLNVPVLNGINLNVARGERIAIVGASGSGKSTLLHLLGGLDQASSGSVSILGQDVQAMNETQRGMLRNTHSVSFTNFITCCRSLPRWRMSQCLY